MRPFGRNHDPARLSGRRLRGPRFRRRALVSECYRPVGTNRPPVRRSRSRYRPVDNRPPVRRYPANRVGPSSTGRPGRPALTGPVPGGGGRAVPLAPTGRNAAPAGRLTARRRPSGPGVRPARRAPPSAGAARSSRSTGAGPSPPLCPAHAFQQARRNGPFQPVRPAAATGVPPHRRLAHVADAPRTAPSHRRRARNAQSTGTPVPGAEPGRSRISRSQVKRCGGTLVSGPPSTTEPSRSAVAADAA